MQNAARLKPPTRHHTNLRTFKRKSRARVCTISRNGSTAGQGADAKKPNPHTQKFDQTVQEKLLELDYSAEDDVESIYDKLCRVINFAAETTLPKRHSKRGIKRKVSAKTKKLYDERVAKADCADHDQKAHQKKIKEAHTLIT